MATPSNAKPPRKLADVLLDTPSYAVRNHHFYEKLGYVKVGEDARDGSSLIAYQKGVEQGGVLAE